jgi:predicted permease
MIIITVFGILTIYVIMIGGMMVSDDSAAGNARFVVTDFLPAWMFSKFACAHNNLLF